MKLRYALLAIPMFAGVSLAGGQSQCVDSPLQYGTFSHRSAPEEDLTIVSLNMAKENDREKILKDLRRTSFFDTADVWLLQEAVGVVPEVAHAMNLDYVYAPANGASGLAILSRYPIENPERTSLARHNLIFKSRCRIALSAVIDSLRIVNVHLDTRIGPQQRLDQVSPLLNGDRMVLGGDFNTNNFRWILHLLPIPGQNHSGKLRDLIVSHGFESPLDKVGKTFKFLGLPLHLDWIFPKDLKTVKAGVEKIDFSDHHAVWVSVDTD